MYAYCYADYLIVSKQLFIIRTAPCHVKDSMKKTTAVIVHKIGHLAHKTVDNLLRIFW